MRLFCKFSLFFYLIKILLRYLLHYNNNHDDIFLGSCKKDTTSTEMIVTIVVNFTIFMG